MTVFGADTAYEAGMFESVVADLAGSGLYATAYTNLEVNPDIHGAFISAGGDSFEVEEIDPIVNDLRGVKSQIEIAAIQSSVDVTVQAFLEGIAAIEPGVHEYEVDAVFDYVLRVNGCPRAAFPTIVASGPNINTLHWPAGDRKMLDGDLVMIDFGAEYAYYAADVTRTLPVNGTFSAEQATIYSIVLEAHNTVLEAAMPGVNFRDLYLQARDMVLDGLLAAGVIQGSMQEIIESQRYRLYIPAGLGHPVGLDVHDPWPSYGGEERQLQANMVIAFEPHVYLTEDDVTVAPAYRGIAARVEDTVLITPSGAVIMSGELPREIAEIEELMR
jgi:Xaa-Pro aminopeptidase